MNAALGAVSTGGMGTPEFDVTHNGGAPCAFVAIHPIGSAGGITLSKPSIHVTGIIQRPEHEMDAIGVALLCDKP